MVSTQLKNTRVKLGIISEIGGEIKQYLKPPPRIENINLQITLHYTSNDYCLGPAEHHTSAEPQSKS